MPNAFHHDEVFLDLNEEQLKDYLIEKLQLVDISTAPNRSTLGPAGWGSYKKHHIMFQDPTGSDMEWCSVPEKGVKISARNWLDYRMPQNLVDSKDLLELIKEYGRYNDAKGTMDTKDIKGNILSKLSILEIKD